MPPPLALAAAIRAALASVREDERDLTVRRVFQALRIAVNDEFSALDTFLRHLPACLNPGGRVAILTFHSGEDRRVKNRSKPACATELMPRSLMEFCVRVLKSSAPIPAPYQPNSAGLDGRTNSDLPANRT